MTSTALACTVKNYLRVVENLTADLRVNIILPGIFILMQHPMMIYATGYIVVKTINDNTMSSVRLSIRLLFRFNGKVYIEDCIFILKIQNSLVYRTLNCYLYCFIILENYIFLWSVRLYWSSYMQTSCKKLVLSEHFPIVSSEPVANRINLHF